MQESESNTTFSLDASLPIKDQCARLFNSWIKEWKEWWQTKSLLRKIIPFAAVSLYWVLLWFLHGIRNDHLLIGGCLLSLIYGGPRFRVLFRFSLPFLLTAIIYDSQRFYSDFLRGDIHVEFPYAFDKAFFGIPTQKGVLTPGEWLQKHTHPALDLVAGFAYLVFFLQYIGVSAYFNFWLSRKGTHKLTASEITIQAPKVGQAFLWLNLLGYSTYYWFPAAPPWYVTLYGLGPARLDTPAHPAGCLRFDQILGTHFFSEMYGRSADVFGAIPSLHVAYPLLATYYAFKFGRLRAFCFGFYLLMCFSAVYLNHHYVIDVLWGSAYALLIGFALDRLTSRKNVLLG